MARRLRAATRGSPLARWQTEHVSRLLGEVAGVEVEAVVVETTADRRLDVPIHAMGGKGVFVKEVQAAVLDGRADIAVHSAKDLPSIGVDELVLAAVPERGDPRDALVGCRLRDLAPGATVATGSIRRRAQLAALRPDLEFVELRGNIATRLGKIPDGGAIVMAAAAIQRLALTPDVVDVLDVATMLPQVGQGALAVECRRDDEETIALLAAIEHDATRRAVDAERAFLAELGGDCDLPAGAHATVDGAETTLEALLARPDGRGALRAARSGVDATIGRDLARHLLDDRGGAALLAGGPAPLAGRRVLVTRPQGQASELTAGLRRLGAEPIEVPLIEIAEPDDGGAALAAAASEIAQYDWVVVTSPNGAARLTGALGGATAPTRVAAVGPTTASALAAGGLAADLVAERHVAEGLLEEFPPPAGAGRVLIVHPADARPVLPEGLRAAGWDVEVVVAYRTVAAPVSSAQREAVAGADIVTFTSSSTVDRFVDSFGVEAVPSLVACIGPVTAATARAHGIEVEVEATEHTVDGLLAALAASAS